MSRVHAGPASPATEDAATIRACYVVTDDGTILVQIPDDSEWGFALADDDQTWEGGFGVAASWTALADDDPRITDEDRERLGWVLDEARA